MNITYKGNDIILENVECLDLDLTLDCGQAFRWVKNDDNSWSGVVKGVYLNISKNGNTVILKNTTKESYENIWKNYFDFEKDYAKICDTLKQDKLIAPTVDEYYGIRILNQDSWEALCSFVISQQTAMTSLTAKNWIPVVYEGCLFLIRYRHLYLVVS